MLLAFLFLTQMAQALELPTGMDQRERQTTLDTVGLGGSSKLLSDPYPLGGYSGVEIGVSEEIIPAEELSRLGNKTASKSDIAYTQISIGKGLYYDVDLFLNFIPLGDNTEISGYGGQLRWAFFQAQYLPTHMSLILHGNSLQVHGIFSTRSIGADLVTAFDLQDFSLYFGVGRVEADGTFIGANANLTDNGQTVDEKTSSLHTFIGSSLRWSPYFLAIEMDRYAQTVYAVKVGLRY